MKIGSRVKGRDGRGVIVSGPRRASPGMAWVLWDGNQAPFLVNRFYLSLDKRPIAEPVTNEQALRDVLNAYDDGVRSCVGVMANGELCWKGSFIAYMERIREMLPPQE